MTTESNKVLDKMEEAPPNSLPDWTECQMRVENSKFIAKRVAEGGYPAEPDSKLANELHHFIYEYDDADPYRSAWFLHRLEKLITFVQEQALSQRAPTAAAPDLRPGLEAAARWVDRQRSEFDAQHGYEDPDTGFWEYGTGRHAEAKAEHSATLAEISEGIRALCPTAAAEAAPVVPEFPGRVLDVIHDMADRSSRDGMAPWYDELGPMQDDADAALNWIKEASRCIALSTPQAVEAQQAGSEGEPIVNNEFQRAWIKLEKLPGVMMNGGIGPVPASTSAWITTSEQERDYMRARGEPTIEVWLSRAAPAEPAAPPEGYLPIPEDEQERRLFDLATETYGRDVRANINLTLRLFAKQRPGGSYEAIMNIMANEVLKMHIVPTAEPAPSVTDEQINALALSFTRTAEHSTSCVVEVVPFARAVLALAQGGAK